MKKEFQIAVDLKRPVSNAPIRVVEGDTGNVFYLTVSDDSVPVDLTDAAVTVAFSKEDGTTALQDAETGLSVVNALQGKLRLALRTQSFSHSTSVTSELQIAKDNTITTAKFNFDVARPIINEDTAQATSEWPVLQRLSAQANQAVQDAQTALSHAQTATNGANTAAQAAQEQAQYAHNQGAGAQEQAEAAQTQAAAAQTAGQAAQSAATFAHEQGAFAQVWGQVAQGIVMEGVTWNTLTGKPTSFPPSTHSHSEYEGQISALSNRAATLENKTKTLVATLTAANQFTVTDESVSTYTDTEIRRVVYFPSASSAPTLRFGVLSILPVYEYGTTLLKVKAGQYVEVFKPAGGTGFFGVSAGGGIALPNPLVAGNDYIVKSANNGTIQSTQKQWYDYGTLTVNKTGVVRCRAYLCGMTNGYFTWGPWASIWRSGVEISSRVHWVSAGWGWVEMDALVTAGDQLLLRFYQGEDPSIIFYCGGFQIMVGWPEIVSYINEQLATI